MSISEKEFWKDINMLAEMRKQNDWQINQDIVLGNS